MFYTHMWINQHNTLVKICRYNAVEYRAANSYQIWIHYWKQCPLTVDVKNKWVSDSTDKEFDDILNINIDTINRSI